MKTTQYSRISHHTVTASGSTFSVPASEDFTDGTWTINDLAQSEIGVSETDGKMFIRIGNTIQEIQLVNTGSTETNFFTGGSGSYSIKALNDSTVYPVGEYSIQLGKNTKASGDEGAVAMGFNTQATDINAVATGRYSVASAMASFAEGDGTLASGMRSHAEGHQTTSSGNASHAGGYKTISSGEYSFCHGSGSTSLGINTVVFGMNITGTSDNSIYTPDVIVDTNKKIQTVNGSSSLSLDFGGSPNELMLSTDGGTWGAAQLYMSNGYVELSDYTTNAGLNMSFGGLVNIGSSVTVAAGLGDTRSNVGCYNSDSSTLDVIAAGGNMVNTVIIGGSGITATKSNTVYTKYLAPYIPSYANDAAADADTALSSGGLYKITGSRAVYQKP